MLIPGIGTARVLVAPARRLRHDGPIHRIRQPHETLGGPVPLGVLGIPVLVVRVDIERPAAGEIPVQPVAETHLELGVGTQAAIDLGDPVAHADPVCREIRADAHRPLRVPHIIFEARWLGRIEADPVILMRPVGIAYIEIGNHVVDEIVDIDVMREGGIRRAIRIATLDPLVGRIGLQPLAGQREHGAPGLGVAVGGRAVGVGVPILLLSSEIGGRERMIRPLDGIVEAPVDTVDIDVDEALVGGDIAHGKNGLTPKGIADKKRVIPGSAPLPAIV